MEITNANILKLLVKANVLTEDQCFDLCMGMNGLNGFMSSNLSYFKIEELDNYIDDPYEAMRATYFGKVNFAKDYLRFDGYDNLESVTEEEIAKECKRCYVYDMLHEDDSDLENCINDVPLGLEDWQLEEFSIWLKYDGYFASDLRTEILAIAETF